VTVADPAVPAGPLARLGAWARHHVPTRESIERSRWLKPVAHHILTPSLWRFTRRSVPRAVALGTLTGILFPFAHMPLAAVLAVPARANVPVAVATTLINNPLTFVPLMWLGHSIGHWVLRLDRQVPGRPIASNIHANESWLHWIASGGPSLIVGLTILAIGLATFAYAGTSLVWRFRIARKWRGRSARKAR
jgi:uncharacterized protein (DUF2062 family)